MFWVIPAGLLASGLAVFKFGYLSKIQMALGLQSAEEQESINELFNKLQEKSGAVYAVISGTIQSNNPIDIINEGGGMKVVAWIRNQYRVMEEWSRTNRRWSTVQQKITEEARETSFFVMDQSGSISVLRDSRLELPMIKVMERFDRAPSTFAQSVIEKLVLETRDLGTRTEELALPVGTHVYAVGEAFLDKANGKLILRNPGSKPFLIAQSPMNEIIKRMKKSARIYWWVSVILIALGCSLVAYKGYTIFKKRAATRPEEYSGERKCCICLSRESTVVFLPCSHVCSCRDCSPELQTCPICRARIQSRREIVFS